MQRGGKGSQRSPVGQATAGGALEATRFPGGALRGGLG